MLSVFSPILDSTSKSFVYQQNKGLTIKFTLPLFMTLQSVQEFQVTVVRQNDNSNMLNSAYYSVMKQSNNQREINIPSSAFRNPLQNGNLYKIQIRLRSSFGEYSEWSNEQIIKPISVPSIIAGYEEGSNAITPTLYGQCLFQDGEKEIVESFNFKLLKDGKEIFNSGWQAHSAVSDKDIVQVNISLQERQKYTMIYSIISNNGYEASTQETLEPIQKEMKQLAIAVFAQPDEEKGGIKVTVSSQEKDRIWYGNFVISRLNESGIWEDLKYLHLGNQVLYNYEYIDFTVESGKIYQYAIQYEANNGIRTRKNISNKACVNLEYMYILSKNKSLKLAYNVQLSSFMRQTLVSKSDTIGSRFPTISKNGYANYVTFQIDGLLSFALDEFDNTFFDYIPGQGFYYGNELVIKDSLYKDDEGEIKYNRDQTFDNIYIERAFREKAIEFLSNEDYKLVRTATEGTYIMVFTNVKLTPQTPLNRMIYSFSAIAYEVADYSIQNLNEYSIIDIGTFNSNIQVSSYNYNLGQVVFYGINSSDNFTNIIKNSIVLKESGDYIEEYCGLSKFSIDNQSINERVIIEVNGANIVVLPNREYHMLDFQLNMEDRIRVIESPLEGFIFNFIYATRYKKKTTKAVIYTEKEYKIFQINKDIIQTNSLKYNSNLLAELSSILLVGHISTDYEIYSLEGIVSMKLYDVENSSQQIEVGIEDSNGVLQKSLITLGLTQCYILHPLEDSINYLSLLGEEDTNINCIIDIVYCIKREELMEEI